MNINQF